MRKQWMDRCPDPYRNECKNESLCANNAETPYPCYISVEGRDEKEDGKRSNGC
jgi:hypothetical protein